jgi:hypothetical protein
MKSALTSLMLVAALLMLTVPAYAQDAPDMPPVLKEQLGLCPDCTVLESTQVNDAETCLLDCGGNHPNKMAGFYKRQMDNNGFTNTSLSGAGGGALAMGEKQGSTANALATKEDGVTQVLLTIDNIAALGGAPVAEPQVAEAAPEPAAETPAEEPAAEPATEPAATQAESSGVIGQGLANEIWELVEPRSQDTLIEEMVLHNHPVAIFATDGPIDAVLDYYRQAMEAKEWMKVSHMVEPDGGLLVMVTQGMQMTIICEAGLHPDNPGLGYSIMLAKAPQQ